MTQLPTRSYYLHLREAPFRAQLVRSPRLDLEGLRALANEVPEEVREFIRRGTVAVPREAAERAERERTGPRAAREMREHPVLRQRRQRPHDDDLPELG